MAYRHVVRQPRLQSRVFLPNWFMKVVRPGKELPDNVVQFHIPMEGWENLYYDLRSDSYHPSISCHLDRGMSKLDVRNYLQSIYKVNVANVNTRIQQGKTKQVAKGGRLTKVKLPDYKVAYVTLAEGTFKFPDLFPKELAADDSAPSPPDTTDTKETIGSKTGGPFQWFG